MQDTQNPDVNTPITDDNSDVENENNNTGNEDREVPVPPDSRRNAPIEEPPDTDAPSMEENNDEPKRIA